MLSIFVAVALLMTPNGPQAVAFPNPFPTIEACNEWRKDADTKMPAGSVIMSKCIKLGVEV